MMMPFYDNGQLAFMLVHHEYIDVNGEKAYKVMSNLPSVILRDTENNYYDWLLSDDEFLQKNNYSIVDRMGNEILDNPNARPLYFPKSLLKENEFSLNSWHQLQRCMGNFVKKPNEIYSPTNNKIHYYSQSMRFVTYYYYFPAEFWVQTRPSCREEFEGALSSKDMKEEYINYVGDGNNFYYVENNYLRFYVLCNGIKPILTITAPLR